MLNLTSIRKSIISTGSIFGKIGVGLWGKDQESHQTILPHILPYFFVEIMGVRLHVFN